MKLLPLILLFPLLVNAQPNKKIDAENFQSIPVDLKLIPDYDLYELRFDILRQQVTIQNTDTTTTSESSGYHPLGFDIGNCLYIDLNHNLSFRIDQLLGIDKNEPFRIESYSKNEGQKNKRMYQFEQDRFASKKSKNSRFHEKFNIENVDETINVYHRSRYLHSIEENQSGLFLKRKNRVRNGIYFREDSTYNTHKKPHRAEKFWANTNGIHIDRELVITTSDDHKIIEVRGKRWFHRTSLLYNIQYNQNEIIVYNRKKNGYHIFLSPMKVEIFRKNKLLESYTRIN